MGEAWHSETACALGEKIESGEVDPVDLTDYFLERIESVDKVGLIYLRTMPERARSEAMAARDRARNGVRVGPLDGVPISWKDIYDTAGVLTEMGSPLLAGRTPDHDAEVLARASRAGTICLGKTNTVQFALGGIGRNPATGTPPNAVMTDVPRSPGGSSSGAATSTALGLAAAGIGSDTGGSVRIPSAWNNLVGLKTSAGAVPTTGVLALSPSLDTVGPLTHSVADAAALFSILADQPAIDLSQGDVNRLHFLVADSVVWDQADSAVVDAVNGAIDRLSQAGAKISRGPVPAFSEIDTLLDRRGGIVTAEGYSEWKHLIDSQPEQIDPFVLDRFLQGRDMTAADVETVRAAAKRLAGVLYQQMAEFDAVLAPTAPILPPPLSDMEDSEAYSTKNALALRNTRLGNVLPCCALTLPCGEPEIPVGLMAMAPAGADRFLLRVGAIVEKIVRGNS